MLNTKKTLITFLTFALLILLSPVAKAEGVPSLNSNADREAKMQERAALKETKMQELEEKKTQLMMEKEERMLLRQEELEAKKLMMMEEREAKKAERTAFRCELLQNQVNNQIEKMNRNTTRIDEMKAKWTSNLEKLEAKGYDLPEITQLENDLQAFFTLLDEYKALQTQLNADLASTKLTACNTDLSAEEAKELAQTLKDQLQERRDALALKKTEINAFYNDVIKADILAIRLAIKNMEASEETDTPVEEAEAESTNQETNE